MKLLQYRSLTYCIALGIAVATTIFGFRFWAIFNYGLELPLNDEWYSEWHTLYAPYLSGTLTASEFMLRNDVHNIALQKCLQLVVFALAGEWNPTLLMVLNASLFSLFCGMLAAAAARVIETASFVVGFTMILVLLGGLPAAMENFLFGFQTAWCVYYFLSFLTCWFLFRSRNRPWLFGLGMMCALLSAFCLSSGLVNIAIAAIPLTQDFISFLRKPEERCFHFWIKLLFTILVAAVYFSLPGTNHPSLTTPLEMLNGLVQGLSWPAPWGFFPLVQTAAIILLAVEFWRLKTGVIHTVSFHIYLMAWSFLHLCAIAATRGGFSSRHTELFYFSILSTLFGCAVVKQYFRHGLLNRLLCLWFWFILAGILFQMGLGCGATSCLERFLAGTV